MQTIYYYQQDDTAIEYIVDMFPVARTLTIGPDIGDYAKVVRKRACLVVLHSFPQMCVAQLSGPVAQSIWDASHVFFQACLDPRVEYTPVWSELPKTIVDQLQVHTVIYDVVGIVQKSSGKIKTPYQLGNSTLVPGSVFYLTTKTSFFVQDDE